MLQRKYSVGELRRIVQESSEHFKPVIGNNVDKDNKQNNEKAYKETFNKVKTENEKITNPIKPSDDDNKGMQDLEYENMNDAFKKRVKSQMNGYSSENAENEHKNDEFGNASFRKFDGSDKAKNFKKGKDTASEIGLTSRELPKKDIENQSKTIYNENKVFRLKFKNTVFVSESHVLDRIPDDYKKDGNRFYVVDKNNTEYIVEWKTEGKPLITNKTKINEQNNRIKELFNYKSGNEKTSPKSRLAENTAFDDVLKKARNLAK